MMIDDERSNLAGSETWRLFIAVPLPLAAREIMRDFQSRLKTHGWPVRWVDPDLAHITLKFLGDTRSVDVPAIERELRVVAARNQATVAAVGAVGAFPSASRARVVWLGLDGDLRPLANLARDVDCAMEGCGFSPDDRPFRPHITLGRVRQGKRIPGDFAAAIEALDTPDTTTSLDRVQLVRSVLKSSGPEYTTLCEWQLEASSSGPAGQVIELVEHG